MVSGIDGVWYRWCLVSMVSGVGLFRLLWLICHLGLITDQW